MYCGYCKELVTVDSGLARNREKFYYYKCSTKKNKHLPCDLNTIRKDVLEELVVSKIKTAILESKALNKIADYICKSYNSTFSNDSVLKENEKALARNKKETDNIVIAIASGIINDALIERLDASTEEKNQLELENMKLKLKAKTKLTPEDSLNFLHSMIDLDNNTEAYKKRLIQRFVNKVILYNDRMDIYLIAVNELEIDTVELFTEDNKKERNNINLIVGKGCLVLQCVLC